MSSKVSPASQTQQQQHPPPTAKESSAAKHLLVKLVALVARAYYEPKHVIVFDLLSSFNSCKDDFLARCLRIQTKELHKICGTLKLQGLIKVETRPEPVGPPIEGKPQRKVNKSYYYIDYKQFVDVVKWKIYKIGKMIEKEVQMQMANMPYICPTCQKSYSALDFLSLAKSPSMLPLCEICSTPLVEGRSRDSTSQMSEKYTKFMTESLPLVNILKEVDKYKIPEWVSDAGQNLESTNIKGEGELKYSTEKGAERMNIIVEVEGANGEDEDEEFEDVGVTDPMAQYYANLQAQLGAKQPDDSSLSTGEGDGSPTSDAPQKRKRGDSDLSDSKRPKVEEPAVTLGDPVVQVLDDDEFDDEEFEEI
ncbi:hypothetical protein HDU85_002753 [Gaertneriomyces sp. JEL0708]|nr:hypothetical protein HDU85_002753 [Gaertneriomyces sp. JEL0708]